MGHCHLIFNSIFPGIIPGGQDGKGEGMSQAGQVDSSEFQYSAEWINKLETVEHWQQYWKQISFFQKALSENDTVLEIGVGSGFTASYLRSMGFTVTTLDIDESKNPGIVQNIALDPIAGQYHVVSAFEVLEHIPEKYLPAILRNIHATGAKYFLLSLPEYFPIFIRFEGRLSIIKDFSIRIKRPKFLPNPILTKHHHWEVNSSKSVATDQLKQQFQQAGFKVLEAELFMDKHFFILKRID